MAPLLALLVGGCTGEDLAGRGDVTFSITGGEALKTGFPHTESGVTYSFVDGWSVKLTKFVVVVGQLELTDPLTAEVVASWDETVVVDLQSSQTADSKSKSKGADQLTVLEGVSALRHDVGFVMPVINDSTINRSAAPADVALMKQKRWSVLWEGEATKGTEVVTFRFGLSIPTRNYHCVNGVDKTRGLAVESDKSTAAYIYAHVIHPFWDSLAFGDEDLRFDPFAAVAQNGHVTEAELATQDLNNLIGVDGKPLTDSHGNRIYYNDAGLLPLDKQNLLEYVRYAIRSGSHFNGIGRCKMRFLEKGSHTP